MSEFQTFVNLTWPFFVAAILMRVVCWSIAYGLHFLSQAMDDVHKD